MTFKNSAFVFFLVAFAEVSTWTVDLPEVRKFLFDKYDDSKKSDNDKIVVEDDGRVFYSNIDGNSLHHESHEDHDKNYANEYGYVSYMEKKVSGVVRNGSVYLEGLRAAIERYTQYLESCNNRNDSVTRNLAPWQPQIDMPRVNRTSSTLNFTSPSPNLTTPRTSYNSSNMSNNCEEVNKRSENVRRLAQLAMWSTRRLQDLAFARKYQKIDEYEENELILKLAWFLDRLAYLTGYEPEPKDFLPVTTARPATVSPTPLTAVPAPEPVKNAMMDCLKENSSVPATERCRYPLPIPDIVRQLTNTSGPTAGIETSTEPMDVIPVTALDSIPQQSLELLITSDDNPFRNYAPFKPRNKRHINSYSSNNMIKNPFRHFSFLEYFKNKLTDSKSIVKTIEESIGHKKIEANDISSVKMTNQISPVFDKPIIVIDNQVSNKISIPKKKALLKKFYNNPFLPNLFWNKKVVNSKKSVRKRSVDSPISKLMNYYFKYKVWEGSNPLNDKSYYGNDPPFSQADITEAVSAYDVENHLASRTRPRRSLMHKKDGHLHILTPLKNLRSFIKHKKRIHHNTLVVQKPKIVSHLETIRHQINFGKVDVTKKHIRKRSYENLNMPRESENPFKDISYYVKNKEGREYNPSLMQAAQVRAGLEQIFQTGNIEVVRRYGSNYNPADPAPFFTGLLRANADS